VWTTAQPRGALADGVAPARPISDGHGKYGARPVDPVAGVQQPATRVRFRTVLENHSRRSLIFRVFTQPRSLADMADGKIRVRFASDSGQSRQTRSTSANCQQQKLSGAAKKLLYSICSSAINNRPDKVIDRSVALAPLSD
jgi:hypothetical protein